MWINFIPVSSIWQILYSLQTSVPWPTRQLIRPWQLVIICRKSCPISIVTEYAVVVLTTNDPNFSVVHDYSKDFQWFRCFQSKMNEFDMNKFKNYCKMVHKNDQIILLRKAVAKHQPIIVQPTVPPVYSHLYCHKIFLHISNNNVIFCFWSIF